MSSPETLQHVKGPSKNAPTTKPSSRRRRDPTQRNKMKTGRSSATAATLRATNKSSNLDGGTLSLLSSSDSANITTAAADAVLSSTSSSSSSLSLVTDSSVSPTPSAAQSIDGGKRFDFDRERPPSLSLTAYHVCIVGQESGKSSLVGKYIDGDSFVLKTDAGLFGIGEAPTDEEVSEKTTNVDGESCIVSILDIAGTVVMEESWRRWFKMVEGFILVFDITDRSSFQQIKPFYQKILKYTKQKKIPGVLVGAKCDLEQIRVIQISEAQKLAKSLSLPYVESSALTGKNVTKVFSTCVIEIRKHLKEMANLNPKRSIGAKMLGSVSKFGLKKSTGKGPKLPNDPDLSSPPVEESMQISGPTSVKRQESILASKDGNMIWSPSSFEFKKKIGSGSYGSVHAAEWKATGGKFAIKVMVPEPGEEDEIKNEYEILKLCRSPYITSYYGVVKNTPELWIILEYCGGGSIINIMSTVQRCLSEVQISYVLREVLRGLVYLHQEVNILHRDLKAANILLTDDGQVKIADFGVSRHFTPANRFKTQSLIGTPHWIAPEIWLTEDSESSGYSFPADIWSLGITGYELALGRPPNANLGPLKLCVRLSRFGPPRLPSDQNFSSSFTSFIHSCLQMDPFKRPTARQLLDHPFIANSPGPECLKLMVKKYYQIKEKQEKNKRR